VLPVIERLTPTATDPCRSETIATAKVFADAFHNSRGHRGAQDLQRGKGSRERQGRAVHDPQRRRNGGWFRFRWRRFEIKDIPIPLLARVMGTVAGNEMIRQLNSFVARFCERLGGYEPMPISRRLLRPSCASVKIQEAASAETTVSRNPPPSS
jgi:hypothetical protein